MLIDHLIYGAPDLAGAVGDLVERLGVLMLNVIPGGLVPFLISWGDTEHPARSAPRGLKLESFHLEHPFPASLAPPLTALCADAEIRPATIPALIARLSGPNGSTVLH